LVGTLASVVFAQGSDKGASLRWSGALGAL